MSSRLLSNAQCPASRILKQCGVNPFNEYIPLKNLLTGAIIPADLEDDFIDFASKGQQSMQAFVQDRLVTTTAIKSFWDTLKKLGLSSYSTWYKEKSVKLKGKVYQLKEDKHILTRCLMLQEARPDSFPPLPTLINDWELTVIPPAFFANDGSILLPTTKSELMGCLALPTSAKYPAVLQFFGGNHGHEHASQLDPPCSLLTRMEKAQLQRLTHT